jgi:hypothetical protein
MRSATLQLTLTESQFTLTPLSPHSASLCTHEDGCRNLSTHRLLWRATGRVALMCDHHTVEWAQEHGNHVTTAKLDAPAA